MDASPFPVRWKAQVVCPGCSDGWLRCGYRASIGLWSVARQPGALALADLVAASVHRMSRATSSAKLGRLSCSAMTQALPRWWVSGVYIEGDQQVGRTAPQCPKGAAAVGEFGCARVRSAIRANTPKSGRGPTPLRLRTSFPNRGRSRGSVVDVTASTGTSSVVAGIQIVDQPPSRPVRRGRGRHVLLGGAPGGLMGGHGARAMQFGLAHAVVGVCRE